MKPLLDSVPAYHSIEPIKRYGHKDPKSLWIAVLAVSVTVHLGLLVVLLIMNLRASTAAIDRANIPVEIVELSPQPATPEQDTTPQVSPSLPATSTPPSEPSPTSQESTSNPDFSPPDESTPSPSPDRPGDQPNQPTPSPSGEQPTPSPNQPAPTPSSPGQNENQPTSSPSSSPGTSSPSTRSPDGQLAQVPISSAPPPPAGISATLVRIEAGAPQVEGTQRDLSPYQPEPTEKSKFFLSDASGCVLKPTSLRAVGRSVRLYIVVENRTNQPGRVMTDDTRIQEGSGNPDYDELVKCLVNTWEFQPAPPGTQPLSDLIVEFTLSQASQG